MYICINTKPRNFDINSFISIYLFKVDLEAHGPISSQINNAIIVQASQYMTEWE